GLAEAYIGLGFEGWMAPRDALEKGQAAMTKALALDEPIVKGSFVLSNLKAFQWDFAGSRAALREAIRLNPGDGGVHKYYSQHLRAMGRWEEAFNEGVRARDLDPLGVETSSALGATYLWAGQVDRAIEQIRKTLDLEPGSATVHELLADAYARKGLYKEAINEWRQGLTLSDAEPLAIALVADFVGAGYEDAMKNFHRGQLEALTRAAKERYVSAVEFAALYASLGDREQAFRWIDKAVDDHNPWLYFFKTDPAFEILHGDPRFPALLRR